MSILVNNDTKFPRLTVGTSAEFFEHLKDAFSVLYDEGLRHPKMMSIGLHPRVVGHPARSAGLARFLDYLARFDDVWITRRGDIARHWHLRHRPA